MNQVITNTDDRRLSMAYFAGLFILAVAIPCLAFIKSSNLAYTLPKEELAALKEKERILKSFAELSDALRQYETAQTMESPDLYDKASLCGDLSTRLHSDLRTKDTFRIYKDVVQFLRMADQYKSYIAKSSRNLDEKTKAIELGNAQLLNDKMALQNENTQLKIAMAAAAAKGGGGGGAAPAPIYIPAPAPTSTTAAAAPSQPLIIPTPNTGDANCDGKITQIKSSFKAMCLDMRSKITQVQMDVKSISKGLLGGNKAEKQRIETNLMQLDRQLEGSLSN